MVKREYCNEAIGERYYEADHESGLKILICEKPEFTGAYAMFGTRYGSIDNCFKTQGDAGFTEVPDGIAHFLEHKLFESEDGDAFSRYAETGASANAYTSFDRTCYLFSCNDRFEDSLRILLDFVQAPYFTQQTVSKEQGIIGQEIAMYDDSPDWVLLLNLFQAMYSANPIRINIAGTQQSIAKITADLLYKCYRTFYNLANMFLVVAGNVDADRVLAIAQEMLKDSEPVKVIRRPYEEADTVVQKRVEAKMSVALPQFALGFKEPCREPLLSIRDKLETDMLIDLIAGKQSALYKRLLDEGLINGQFSAGLFDGYNYNMELFSGESSDPDRVVQAIQDEISRMRREGIDRSDFERIKKSYYGRYLMNFNHIENIADQLVECAYAGRGLFDDIDVYRSVTVQALEKRLADQMLADRCSLSVILPMV